MKKVNTESRKALEKFFDKKIFLGRRGTGDEGRETGDEGWGRIIPRFPVHTGWEREGIP